MKNPKSRENISHLLKKGVSRKVAWLYLFALLSLGTWTKVTAQQSDIHPARQENISYDYQTLLHIPVQELSETLVKQVMLQRLNELRLKDKLPPLTYDSRLETLAFDFAQEKNGTEWQKDPYVHFDKENLGVIDRAKRKWFRSQINRHTIDEQVMWLWENLVGTNTNIDKMLTVLMNSPEHKKRLLCPYVTKVGFWYKKWYNILVQIFADIK